MNIFEKGTYKVYFYNDRIVFDKFFETYRKYPMFDEIYKKGCNTDGSTPYYVRFKNGSYMGKNTNGECVGTDTPDMIFYDAKSLICIIPEDLFIL